MIWILLIELFLGGFRLADQIPSKQIAITLPKNTYSLGEPMPLHVTYTNTGHGVISLREPKRTWEVGVNVIDLDGNEAQVHLGRKILKKADNMESVSSEPAATIGLDPGKQYTFDCDLVDRFPDVLPPGTFSLYLQDRTTDSASIESNRIKVNVFFTVESVTFLLQTASDKTKEPFARRTAVKWLSRLKRDFSPKIPNLNDPDSVKQECETLTAKELKQFRVWWGTAQVTTEVTEIIERINYVFFDKRQLIEQFNEEQ